MSYSLHSDDSERPSTGRMVATTLAWAALFAVTVFVGTAGIIPQLLGAATQPMRSGALEPRVSQGDLVVSEPVDPSTLEVGDLITFRPPGEAPPLVREVRAVEPPETILPATPDRASVAAIVTSGDASAAEHRVSPGQILGKVLYVVPFAGFFSDEGLWGASPILIVLAGAVIFAGVVYLRYRRGASRE